MISNAHGKQDSKIKRSPLIGIDVRKELDFPGWYQQVLTKGDMVYYLIVRSSCEARLLRCVWMLYPEAMGV